MLINVDPISDLNPEVYGHGAPRDAYKSLLMSRDWTDAVGN